MRGAGTKHTSYFNIIADYHKKKKTDGVIDILSME